MKGNSIPLLASTASRSYSHLNGRKALSLLLGAFLLLLCTPFGAIAQDTSSISGTVSDKSGAVVAGAQLVVSSASGNLTRNTVTNNAGAYVVAALPADTYDLVVTASGFQQFLAEGVVLPVAQKIRVDVALTVGTITEKITVTGESVVQVETSSSEIGTTIDGKQVNQLVLNGRNFSQLVTLVPGVVDQTFQDAAEVGPLGQVTYSINGGRSEHNNWQIDGNDNQDSGSNQQLNVTPNLEAIAEVKVLTSTYGAQYGRNASGTIEVETKSGTNAFHGSAFEYLRNDFFNAKSWAAGADPTAKKPAYKKHDFGYTIGGPIFIPNHYNSDKKKTFFFWSQEWRRENLPSTYTLNVPSNAERTGDFSDLCPTAGTNFTRDPVTGFPDCPSSGPVGTSGTLFATFPNNKVPVDQTNAPFFVALIPKATPGSLINGFPGYLASVSDPSRVREELIRVDHNITDNYRLTFRYIHDSWSNVTPGTLWGGSSSFPNISTNFTAPGTNFVAHLTALITPTLLNEFVAGYTNSHDSLTAIGPVGLPAGYTGGSLFPNNLGGKLPSFSVQNGNAYGGGFGVDTTYFPYSGTNPTYTYRDNVTKIAGNHTLQFGVEFRAVQQNFPNSAYPQGQLSFSNSASNSTGNAFADLLIGRIAGVTQFNQQLKFYDRFKDFEPYFQDDWRITKKLTLNLGLRWSFFGRYQDRYNHIYGFDPSLYSAANAPALDPNTGAILAGSGNQFNGYIQCGVGPAPTGCQNNKLVNPAPRLGFAWDPKGNGKMAIRGGYGIFFDHATGNDSNAQGLSRGASPLVIISSQSNVLGYPNIGNAASGPIAPPFPVNATSIPNRADWAYVQQWNLDVQRQLPAHFVLSVAYVGSKGTHLVNGRDINQLHLFTGANPFTPGQPLTTADCANINNPNTGLPNPNATLGNGTPVPAGALNNLFVACGNNSNLVRTSYPGFGTIDRIETSGSSSYNALQASARRTVGALTLSAAYTFSHSIDTFSDRFTGGFLDSYNLPLSRASSDFDQRHSLAISYVYAIPFKGAGLKNILLGNWQVSGITIIQTGLPFTVINGSGFSDSAGIANGDGAGSLPDLVSNPNAVTQRNFPDVRGPLYYNPAAFAVPTGLTYGNAGRNSLRLPGRTNFDFGLFRRFSFGESRAFEFRWENFNIFNHTQFNSIGTTLDTTSPGTSQDNSSFLHLSGTHDPRIMQFGLRFEF